MARVAGSHDIHCQIQYGDLRVTMVAEAVSWSPDVAEDLMTRTLFGFREAAALIFEDEGADD